MAESNLVTPQSLLFDEGMGFLIRSWVDRDNVKSNWEAWDIYFSFTRFILVTLKQNRMSEFIHHADGLDRSSLATSSG